MDEIRNPAEQSRIIATIAMPRLGFRHWLMLAIMAATAVAGLVALGDLLFFLLAVAYVFFLSSFAFPARSSHPEPLVFSGERERRALGFYVLAGGVVGLALPVAYISWSVVHGDDGGGQIKAAAAHLFLLAGQVFAEGLTFSGAVSLPVRAFVPICFNSRRLFSIADWLRAELAFSDRRLGVGLGLAVGNLVFWSFNLFGFLLPVFLPRALGNHYRNPAKNN